MHKIIHPQEVEVFYLLPAIRRELAIALKEIGRDQKQIAKLLGVSEPSISHYFNLKRGADVEFTDEIKKEIKKIAGSIKTPQDSIMATQKLLKLISQQKGLCKVCHGINKELSESCEACFE